MDFEGDGETLASEDWPERRLAAARRLGRLIRRLGPVAVDSPETLAPMMDEALKTCPVERQVLTDALKLRATNEINRFRGGDDPKTYLPAIAQALASQTGHPPDLASWAVHAWHEVLAVPPSPKFKERVSPIPPPRASGSLVSAFVVGVSAFLATGMIEVLLIRAYGPTVVEVALVERTWPKRNGTPTADRERRPATSERLRTIAPVGFVLAGGAAGLAAFCAWGLGGGSARELARGGPIAALAGAATTGVINFLAIHTHGGLTLAPPVESVAILALTGVITFVATFGVVCRGRGEPDTSQNAETQTNGDDPIQFGSWTSE